MTVRKQLIWFLVCVLLVRVCHICVMPTLLLGMNPGVACSAKMLLQNSANDNNFSFPPLPAMLMAVPALLFDVSPGSLIAAFVAGYSLLYALAFWAWLTSLRINGRLRWYSCWLFLFLPLNNGYEGLDSSQTLLAGLLFMVVALLFHLELGDSSRRRWWLLIATTVLLPMTRTEYCILLPLYLATVTPAYAYFSERFSARRLLSGCAAIAAGLCCGIVIAIAIRLFLTGEFGIVPPEYTCWTFLDGVPSNWLKPSDETEFARRMVGIERFGHPAEYDYSLAAMIITHPVSAIEKFVGNIPRWFFELGGRAQVLPKPAAVFVLVGLVAMLRLRLAGRKKLLLAQLLSTIMMTAPMIGVMLYAEYLRPAYVALCVLMAHGINVVSQWFHWRVMRLSRRTCQHMLVALCCLGMECFYFYSGAHHPDALVLSPVGKMADELVVENGIRRLIIDPYSSVIDATSKTALWNHTLEHSFIDRVGRSTTEPATAIDVLESYRVGREVLASPGARIGVLIWASQAERPELDQRIATWRSLQFDLQSISEISTSNHQTWIVACMLEN